MRVKGDQEGDKIEREAKRLTDRQKEYSDIIQISEIPISFTKKGFDGMDTDNIG